MCAFFFASVEWDGSWISVLKAEKMLQMIHGPCEGSWPIISLYHSAENSAKHNYTKQVNVRLSWWLYAHVPSGYKHEPLFSAWRHVPSTHRQKLACLNSPNQVSSSSLATETMETMLMCVLIVPCCSREDRHLSGQYLQNSTTQTKTKERNGTILCTLDSVLHCNAWGIIPGFTQHINEFTKHWSVPRCMLCAMHHYQTLYNEEPIQTNRAVHWSQLEACSSRSN